MQWNGGATQSMVPSLNPAPTGSLLEMQNISTPPRLMESTVLQDLQIPRPHNNISLNPEAFLLLFANE
jgi:hypothetical protein